jgi:recombination protein RecA
MGIAPTVPPKSNITKLSPVKPKDVELPTQDLRIAKALEHVNKTVKSDNGDPTLLQFNGEIKPRPTISTGSLGLDCALGVGGYPQGRIVEVYGPESSGKTTLTLHAIAEAQKRGGVACFVDAEHALDPLYAKNLHVNMDKLLVCQPDNGEQGLSVVDALIESGIFTWGDIIVVDSVAALVTKAELEGEVGDHHMAQTARLMSQTLKTLVAKLNKSGALLFFTNQIRDSIDTSGYGPKTGTVGGRALKFYASQRIETKRVGSVKVTIAGKEEVVANQTNAYVAKNKVAPPFKTAELKIRFGKGVSKLDELLDLGLLYEEILQKGAYFKGPNLEKDRPSDPAELEKWWVNIGQGRENVLSYLEDHPEMASKIELNLREGLHLTLQH